MAVHYRTQGFILSKNDLREADQVFNVYTKDFGKLKILGKAIRKIKSKLRPGADLLYLSEIEFIQGRNYKTLTDAVLIEKFKNIRNDIDKLNIACQIVEAADSLISGQERDEQIFSLLNETLNRLNDSQSNLIYYYFIWNLFSILGYQINFYNCIHCQNKLLPRKLYFSSEGIICCSESEQEISPEVIKILRIFLKEDWPILLRLKITEIYQKELESISENHLANIRNICNNSLNT